MEVSTIGLTKRLYFSACQLKDDSVVTRYISNIEFLSTARIGDIVEIGMEAIDMGRTSITLKCVVRKKGSDTILTQIDKIVFVLVDGGGALNLIIKHWMRCKRRPNPAF